MRSYSYFTTTGCTALSQISPSCDAIPSTLCKCGPAALWEQASWIPRLAPSSTALGNATTCTLPIFTRNSGFHGGGDGGGDRDKLFYIFDVGGKRFTNVLCSTNAILYLPRARKDLSESDRVSRCWVCPWLGTSPRPRSKQSLAPDRSSRTLWGWFPSGGSQYFSRMSSHSRD